MTISVAPLKLPVSNDPNDRIGNMRLREYQSRLRRCDSPYILLQAPTSSGKTLAYLTRAVGVGKEDSFFGTTIVVYPTNALIWDQARALHFLITCKLRRKCNLVTEIGDEVKWLSYDDNADVDIFVLNGETLAALAEERHTSEGTALINELRKSQAPSRVILTNPEILFYIFQYKFHKSENLITTIFHAGPPNLLILDEFHLYHGFSLAVITYMLNYLKDSFRQMIFSSATPIKVESLIDEECEEIRGVPSDYGDVVRHRMELCLEGTSSILGVEDIAHLQTLVDLCYQRTADEGQTVRVLIILNSVITVARLADVLEKKYPGEVTAIHGLIPSTARPRNQSQFRSIVVGTSAVEVGVDFNTSSLIVEAHNYSSFVQRLGRGARHKDCLSLALIPSLYVNQLKQSLYGKSSQAQVKPQELDSVAKRILPDLPPYSEFSYSVEAVPIMFALLLNWVLQRPAGGRSLSPGMAIDEMKKCLTNGNFNLPGKLKLFQDHMIEMCTKGMVDGGILSLAEKMSCRSSLESLPAIFIDRMPYTFDHLTVHDLPQVDFDIISRESLKRDGVRIPWRMRKFNEFLRVSGIRQEREKVRIDLDKFKFSSSPKPLVNFRIDASDTILADKIQQLLSGNAAYLLYSKEDWRLPGFYTLTGGYVVVGGDAYLSWFIRKQHSETGGLT